MSFSLTKRDVVVRTILGFKSATQSNIVGHSYNRQPASKSSLIVCPSKVLPICNIPTCNIEIRHYPWPSIIRVFIIPNASHEQITCQPSSLSHKQTAFVHVPRPVFILLSLTWPGYEENQRSDLRPRRASKILAARESH